MKIKPYYFFILLIPLILILPLWVIIILLSITIFTCKSSSINTLLSILLIFYFSLFSCNIDITGDIENYNFLFENVYNSSITSEYYLEPLITIFYQFFSALGFDFKQTLFFQSLISNIILLRICILFFNKNGFNYFPFILIFSQYILLNLYLSRQAISIILFLLFLCYQKNLVKSFIPLGLSILSHSISFLYLSIYLVSKKMKINILLYVSLLFIFILFPIQLDSIINYASDLYGFSDSLNRKISFYLNHNELKSELKLYSTLMIPLHISFFILLIESLHKKERTMPNDSIVFIFLFFYLFLILFRDVPVLPTRVSLIIIMISPIFYFYIKDKIITIKEKTLKPFTVFIIAFTFISFIKLIYANDYSTGNIIFFNGNAITMSLISERVLPL